MAGIHNDHTVHRLVSGEAPRVGLRVINNDLKWGTIIKVATDGGCGFYCNAWHDVLVDEDRRSGFNCDRLSTRDMISQSKDPHPERGFTEPPATADTFTVTFPNGDTRCGLSRDQVASIRTNGYEGHGTMTVRQDQTKTGYICKQCSDPSPVGVGYASNQPATGDVETCPCGHSRKPVPS
jgi:hypothetical protein